MGPEGRAVGHEAVIEASGDGYTVLRALRDGPDIVDWLVVDANTLVRSRWLAVTGDIVGVRSSSLNQAADNSTFTELYEAALVTGATQTADLALRLPGGNGGWRRTTVVPLDGDTVAVVTRDITREKYFELALQKNRDDLKRFVPVRIRSTWAQPRSAEGSRFFSLSAAALFLGAGLLTLVNSFVGQLQRIAIGPLRLTGLLSIAGGLLVPLLPWSRYRRATATALVAGALVFLVVSNHFNHYSHEMAAVAVYPVFFIIVVGWSGLALGRGAATVTAGASGWALFQILVDGGHVHTAWQCVVVTMPAAAILGEVMSWSFLRAAELARLEIDRRLHDPLTGLASREQFIEYLDQSLARVRRLQLPMAVLFIDLDRFKQVNDSLGHAFGDQLLIDAAARLREAVRESDCTARFGGDEFAVLCEHLTGTEDAVVVAERVLRTFDEPFEMGDTKAYVSASVGIAFSRDGHEVPDLILQSADVAMYRAKEAGRSRFEIFDETMKQWVADRVELENSLRQAVPRGELRAFCQPIVNCTSGNVVGGEALIRWQRPGYGLVPPSTFVPVAEETGVIVDIGSWILNEACRHAAQWARRWPDRHLTVAVNISNRQVLRSDLTSAVTDALASSGLAPDRLVLELTETTLIDDEVAVQRVLRELRALGVSIALDDFGTGYSSLNYLRTFPINVIKIDSSFTGRIAAEPGAKAIVQAIIGLARELGISVVAEGVETAEHVAQVHGLRCDLLQGYFYSEPLPFDDVAALILDGPRRWAMPGGAAGASVWQAG